MNGPARLVELAQALTDLGLRFLVMGGHAARYYGVERNTLDYDLHLGVDSLEELPVILRRSAQLAAWIEGEGPSWRSHDFRRFIVGRLPDDWNSGGATICFRLLTKPMPGARRVNTVARNFRSYRCPT